MKTIAIAVPALLLVLTVAACTTTNTTPIAPDIFRLDTSASGLLFTGKAGSDTLLKAAQITSEHGYSYFKIIDGASGAGTAYAGSTTNFIGRTMISSPNYSPTQDVSVTIKMLNAPEDGAWAVADVLAKKGEMF